MSRIGPATIGSTTTIPASRGPHRRPTSDEATTSIGASSSFRATIVTGAKCGKDPRRTVYHQPA